MGVKSFLSCSYKSEPYTPLLFRRGSNKVKEFFFCQSPVAAFPVGRRTHKGWHDGKQSCWIMNVVFDACLPFDIIGEILAWPRESGNHGKKILPMRIQNWASHFCALFVKLNLILIEQPIHAHHILWRTEETLWSIHKSLFDFVFWYGWHVVCDCSALNS